jgi:act minimal PKS chain-length factor (CLF/KS beta)
MTSTLITGLGVVAPNGVGVEDYWKAVLTGRSGIGELTGFDASGYPSRLAGQVPGFAAEEQLGSKLRIQMDRSTQLAMVAAQWAIEDAGFVPEEQDDYGVGTVTSNALGGFGFTHHEFRKLWNQGPDFVSVYESFAWFYAVNTGQISIRHGLRGPSAALVGEQAGGLDALGHARRTVRRGTGTVVSGGVDSALDPWGYLSQLAGGLVSREPDPARAYRPFDRAADGYVPGEGGAILVLQEASKALTARQVYGELAGYAASSP